MKKLIIPLLLLLMANFTFAQTSTPPTAGDGTAGNPWQIATLDNLYWLSQTTAEWVEGKYFIQTANIDAATTSTWDSNKGFSPIGNSTNYFYGNYDGDGHTIDGLTINRPTTDNIGFFGYYSAGTLKRLGVINAHIIGQKQVGILLGRSFLTASSNYSVDILNCYTSGTVTGTIYVGGLIGQSGNGAIELCHSTATVVSTSATGFQRSTGGLIGWVYSNSAVVKNCYAQGSVTGASGTNIGGLIGYCVDNATFTNCYASGAVVLSGGSSSYVGGLIGRAGTIYATNCYWDTQTSGQTTSQGGTGVVGKTTAEMKTQGTFAGWNFTSPWEISTGNYPILNQRAFSGGSGTVDAPYQIATIADLLTLMAWPTEWSKHFIQTADIDATGAAGSPIGSFSFPFTGSYNGQNYTVDHFSYNSEESRIGLFGYISSATLTNINATNIIISSPTSFNGGLIGQAINATIDNCFVSGNVSGIMLTGGFVGLAINCTFSNCGADMVVTGILHPTNASFTETSNQGIGGFVGVVLNTPSTFTNCYARGSVSGYIIGGFVGGMTTGDTPPIPAMGFTLTNCYAANTLTLYTTYSATGLSITTPGEKAGLYGDSDYTGSSITMTNSFWDQELSGTSLGYISGTGKTTAEMKTQETYTGWDFSTPAWKIDASKNNGFPYLAWQNLPSAGPTATAPAAGDGSFGNPYQIATLDNLYWLSQEYSIQNLNYSVSYESKYFIQTEDIDAAATSTWDGGQGFSPIGLSSSCQLFYNGNGKTISNLYINRPNASYVGLFGKIYNPIRNLTLANVNIIGNTFVGGLCGSNSGSLVEKCSVSGSVSGVNNIGGLVGYLEYGFIKRSNSTANVTGVFHATPGDGGIGGLVGAFGDGNITINCYATGAVSGASVGVSVGGLVGKVPSGATILVENCYSNGAVSGPEGTSAGGLVGSGANVGYTNCFWDSEASLQSTSAAGISKTTSEMKSIGTYVGWDFDYTWAILADAYPTFDFRLPALSGGDGSALTPYLVSTYADLVAISKYQDFFGLSFKQTANINASASSITAFKSIGNYLIPFNGSYDGDGYTIDGLAQNSTEDDTHGLFGYMNDASIKNVNMTNYSIDAGFLIGCIAGISESSSITNCGATGSLRGILIAGGIVGSLKNSTIANCYTDIDITGNDLYGAEMITHFGGLVGVVDGTSSVISNSYALGSVSGYDFIGGLVGGVDLGSSAIYGSQSPSSDMGFTMTNCYAANTLTASASGATTGGILGQSNYVNTGAVTITNSFWDTEVSGTTEGYIGGTGKTTAEMKTQGTFTDWDFATTPIWKIDALRNGGTPYFAWRNMPIDVPNTQASSLVFSSVHNNDMTIGWTNGSGAARAVFVKEGTGVISAPVNLSTYTASDDWATPGTQLDASGYYCVYNGTENSVKLIGLAKDTEYSVQVFEYNGEAGAAVYNTSVGVDNPLSQTTSNESGTGFNAENASKLMVYPNPAKGMVTLQLGASNRGEVQVCLFDLSGKMQLTQKQTVTDGNSNLQLNLSGLKAGFYQLQIIANQKTETLKLMIE